MKMAELDLSKVPTILLLLQAWRAFSLYKREPIKQSASLHSSATGSFHRHTPSSTYMYVPCLQIVTIMAIHVRFLTMVTMMMVTILTIFVCSLMMLTTHSVSQSGQGVS